MDLKSKEQIDPQNMTEFDLIKLADMVRYD